MRFKKLISAFLAAAFCVSLAGMAFAEKLTKVPTAWMDEHETFLIWYAKEKGWDKEAGLDIDIQYFGSGMDILNALPSGSWVFAGMGGVPAMMGNLRYGTSVIAIGNDESMTNSVLVRPDSPIAKVKGYNKDFPEVLGSPDTVKGKTFLTTTVSSAHYGLSSWLLPPTKPRIICAAHGCARGTPPATRCWRWRARRPVCSRSSRCWRRWAKRSLPE